jgi:protein required for attachment to host cells
MNAYVVVADGARARIFAWQGAEDPSLDGKPSLVEQDNVTNPEARLADREIFSDRAPRKPTGPGAFNAGSNDHRERNRRESQARFVRLMAERVQQSVARAQPARVLLVAEPKLLGEARQEFAAVLPRNLDVVELAENLSKQSAAEIHAHLAQKGLLPAPLNGPTADQFVPRGQPRPGSDIRR